MKTYLTYFDETGDDGITTASSDHFILTSIYMPAEDWQDNFNKIRELRKNLKKQYGLYISEEMHTKHFLTDKNPYRKYNWSKEQKQEIIVAFTKMIGELNLKIINVIILSLTVVGRKNRCIPYIYWAAAIFIVVSNYSNLFLPFAFFLDCSHFTLGYELIVRPEIAGFVKSIRNLFPLV